MSGPSGAPSRHVEVQCPHAHQKANRGMGHWWEQAARHDGLLTAGRPCSENVEVDFYFGGADQVFLAGETSFMTAFTTCCQDKIMQALAATEQLLTEAQVGQPARQAAKVMFVRCLAAKASLGHDGSNRSESVVRVCED